MRCEEHNKKSIMTELDPAVRSHTGSQTAVLNCNLRSLRLRDYGPQVRKPVGLLVNFRVVFVLLGLLP